MATSVQFILDDSLDPDVKGMVLGKQTDLTVPYDVEPNRFYWLVHVVYTSGDSCGHDPTPRHEFVDMYETEEAAERARDALVQHVKDHKSYKYWMSDRPDEKVTYVTSKGVLVAIDAPWLGYFEKVEFIEMVPVMLMSEQKVYRISEFH